MGTRASALIEQQPIVVTPCMVEVYGSGEAIFIQQLWYWQQMNINIRDGLSWVYNTQDEWSRQTGIPKETLRRLIKRLDEKGIIRRANYNKMKMDKTSWYCLNVDLVRSQTSECLEKYERLKRPFDVVETTASHVVETTAPIPEITKTTTNSISSADADSTKNKNEDFLKELIDIVHPGEKVTKSRLSALGARLKEYTHDEIRITVKLFSKSEWHIENRQMTIDNILAPSKFGKWYSKTIDTTPQRRNYASL